MHEMTPGMPEAAEMSHDSLDKIMQQNIQRKSQ
jgi:hypothetical protein